MLLGEGEIDRRPIHPMISHVEVPPLAPDLARAVDVSGNPADVSRRLAELCLVRVGSTDS